jgi:hypothetical protein
MAWYVVTYDVNKRISGGEDAFVEAAGHLGWTTWCPAAGEDGRQILLRLPENTLMGKFASLPAADAAWKQALEATRVLTGRNEVVGKYLLVARRAAILHSDESPGSSARLGKRRRT